jgi:hypothetical protein
MKKLLLTGILVIATAGAFAQGVVSMNTISASVNARATVLGTGEPAGLNAPGTFSVGLYGGPGGTAEDSLQLIGALASFGSTAAQAGYVLTSTGGGNRTIDGVPAGSPAALQIRAWSAGYPTYEAAFASNLGTVFVGKSAVITVSPTAPPSPPAALTGLAGYTVAPVPEPSTIALGLLGLGAIALFRRRK